MQGKSANNYDVVEINDDAKMKFFRDVESISFIENEDEYTPNSPSCPYFALSEMNQIRTNKHLVSYFHLNIASLEFIFFL